MSKKTSFKQRHVAGPPKGKPWVWHTAELRASQVSITLSINARRMLDRIELEHMAHAGKENGRLIVTYNQFVECGITRRLIKPAIDQLVDRGLITVEQLGVLLKDVPNKFTLTYYATNRKTVSNAYEWSAPTDDWRRRENNFHSSRRGTPTVPDGELLASVGKTKPAETLKPLTPPQAPYSSRRGTPFYSSVPIPGSAERPGAERVGRDGIAVTVALPIEPS